ncbi:sporulation initiation phosphotransferase B [Halalkalibacter wakoensis JCM 9140]|uniref:Sporulation initiation phosphotransferase B n=1 Tax=Halalkalibacter wakoensis JCM 9140 TaxID=1236970 RepID=W4Q1I8_9BACI|nr:Spo0B C-terminal domain-containing protein [Halalkalibacter wakoensis]GAE25911.1 sporulation initiation phosphotransferase B [Halalkalibacter wakoensis JCM 9140]
MDSQLDVLKALRQTRHDWLNVMQLIKGNLALKRYDRIDEIIDQVTQQSVCESKITEIKADSVVYFLLTYNWFSNKVKLEMDVAGDVFSLEKDEVQLLRLCKQITEKLTEGSSSESENHLLLTFLFTDDECKITFDFQGHLHIEDQEWDEMLADSNVKLVELVENECVIVASFLRS